MLTTGLFMHFASQLPALAVAVAISTALSKGLLSIAVFLLKAEKCVGL